MEHNKRMEVVATKEARPSRLDKTAAKSIPK